MTELRSDASNADAAAALELLALLAGPKYTVIDDDGYRRGVEFSKIDVGQGAICPIRFYTQRDLPFHRFATHYTLTWDKRGAMNLMNEKGVSVAAHGCAIGHLRRLAEEHASGSPARTNISSQRKLASPEAA